MHIRTRIAVVVTLMATILIAALAGYAHGQTPPQVTPAAVMAPSWPSHAYYPPVQIRANVATASASATLRTSLTVQPTPSQVPTLTLPSAASGLHMRYVGTGTSWARCFPFGKRTGATSGELEYYADSNSQQRPGILALVAQHVQTGGKPYTSGMVCSYPTVWRYGYFEASVLLDPRQGIWPAVWLRGTGSNPYWEVDLLEAVNACDIAYQTLHYSDDLNPLLIHHQRIAAVHIGPGWHRFGAWLRPGWVTLYVDGRQTGEIAVDAPVASYLIANQAVGGSWPGAPNALGFGQPTMDIGGFEVWQ